jgi:multidrug resistance efflux pump
VKIDRVKVAISIPEKEIGRVRNGQKVILNVNALGDRRFDGTVVNRGVTADVISCAPSTSTI